MQSSSETETLSQAEWEDLLPRLLLYTKERLNRLSWRGTDYLPDTNSLAPDIVMQSIEQALSGQRQLPAGMDLFHFLRRTIDSNIRHTDERIRNRKIGEDSLSLADPGASPQQIIEAAQLVDQILKQVGDDPKIRAIFELMYEGYTAVEIAEQLETSITDVYQAKQRIRRKFSNSPISAR
jgi:DNA-directed RNA polymerase specialized sigma24 family protein